MSKIFSIIILCLLISCKNDKSQQTEIDVVKQEFSKIEKEDLNNIDFIEYILDENAKRKISNWLKYDELQAKINEVKNADLSYFKSDKEVVETLIVEFATTIPEVIDNDAINARILIVQTMYYKLNSTINLSTSTKSELKKSITDLLEAFSNLNFQINKKFEKESQNITSSQS